MVHGKTWPLARTDTPADSYCAGALVGELVLGGACNNNATISRLCDLDISMHALDADIMHASEPLVPALLHLVSQPVILQQAACLQHWCCYCRTVSENVS